MPKAKSASRRAAERAGKTLSNKDRNFVNDYSGGNSGGVIDFSQRREDEAIRGLAGRPGAYVRRPHAQTWGYQDIQVSRGGRASPDDPKSRDLSDLGEKARKLRDDGYARLLAEGKKKAKHKGR